MSSDIDELMRKHYSGEIEQPSLIRELIEITVFVLTSVFICIILFSFIGAIVSLHITGKLDQFDDFGGNISFVVLIVTGIYAGLGFWAGRSTFLGEMNRRAWAGTSKKNEDFQNDFQNFLSLSNLMYRLFIGSGFTLLLFYIF